MSKYTITLQEYCQRVYLGQVLERDPDADPVDTIESMTYADYYRIIKECIFPENYEFYTDEPGAKDKFIADFTDKFLYDEIGQDSVPKFRHTLRTFLNLEMTYYRQLYNSQIRSLDDVLKNVDVWRNISGKVLERTGSTSLHEDTQYGRMETRNGSSSQNGSVQHGATDTTKIVPLGSNNMSPLSQQAQGGTDTTNDSSSSQDNVQLGGRDSRGATNIYNTTDSQDLTEHRAGREGVNVVDAVEKYRKLIIDINSDILRAMQRYGLFMLLW